MDIIELYKRHINPEADGADLCEFFDSFNLFLYVKDPNPLFAKIQEEQWESNLTAAREWIFENSKLLQKRNPVISRPKSPFVVHPSP